MFTVTDSAKEELDGFFADKEKASIRIYMAGGG
jgi:Fe-S cluster assembly iron-binding protein IscA